MDLSNKTLTPQVAYNTNNSTAVITDNNNVVNSSILNGTYAASDPTGTIKSSVSDGTLFVS